MQADPAVVLMSLRMSRKSKRDQFISAFIVSWSLVGLGCIAYGANKSLLPYLIMTCVIAVAMNSYTLCRLFISIVQLYMEEKRINTPVV